MASDRIEVRDEADRYVADLDGRQAGVLTFRLQAGRLVLLHTEVDPAFEGRGVGSALARHGLEDARRRGLRVVPACPFVRQYLERHPEAATLVAAPRPGPSRSVRPQA